MRSVRVIRPEPRRSRLLLAAGGVLAQAGLSGQVWAPRQVAAVVHRRPRLVGVANGRLDRRVVPAPAREHRAGTAGATGRVRGHGNRAGGSAGAPPRFAGGTADDALTAWYLGLLPSLWPDDNDGDPAASTLHLVAASLVTAMAVTQVVLVATLGVFAWR